MQREDIRQLTREARWCITRYEEDNDVEALEDARAMIDDILDFEKLAETAVEDEPDTN